MNSTNPTKSFYLSKTFWVNFVTLLAMAVPPVQQWIAENPVSPLVALGAVNVLLRFVTKGAISLSNDEQGGGGAGSGGLAPLLVLCAVAAALVLPSCSVASSALTGAPIPSTAVQRAGQPQAPVIQVASADLAVAEDEARRAEILNEAPPVNGLYDAGRAAEVVREVFTESSK